MLCFISVSAVILSVVAFLKRTKREIKMKTEQLVLLEIKTFVQT
jgi:hypothetical protein